MELYLHVNHPHVIHEIIQGEAVLVNLATGSYYSADQIGAVVWDGVQNGLTTEEIVSTLTEAYTGDTRTIQTGVAAFLQKLQDEGLVLARATPPEEVKSGIPSLPADKPAFVAPVLIKYTEMEDLLLIDPIHDVDTSGWPHRSPRTQGDG